MPVLFGRHPETMRLRYEEIEKNLGKMYDPIGTVQNFNLTFDISWKVMKDILIKRMGVIDFAIGSPRDTLQAAYTNGLIFDDEWLQMLRARNQLAHDYDGSYATEIFELIISVFYDCFEKFKEHVSEYYTNNDLTEGDTFAGNGIE